MLKITKKVMAAIVSDQGCAKWDDYDCGLMARNG